MRTQARKLSIPMPRPRKKAIWRKTISHVLSYAATAIFAVSALLDPVSNGGPSTMTEQDWIVAVAVVVLLIASGIIAENHVPPWISGTALFVAPHWLPEPWNYVAFVVIGVFVTALHVHSLYTMVRNRNRFWMPV